MKPASLTVVLCVCMVVLGAVLVVRACNEAVCGTIVSKCLLTSSCKCEMKNCSCCKDCFNCLDDLYSECCSCVDMCPMPNNTEPIMTKKSHVEELGDPVPQLFAALTESQDMDYRWTTFTFSVDVDLPYFKTNYNNVVKYKLVNVDTKLERADDIITVNCTVAYLSQCMSWNKCKKSCQSMGASSYRWFHDGCCECVGPTCINYGISESRCSECPFDDDVLEDYEYDNEDDYLYEQEIEDSGKKKQ